MPTSQRDQCITSIIEKELVMFLSTQNQGGTASCQQRPDSFRIMRWMNYAVHNDAFLTSYLADLNNAEAAGRNFMIEKYARMDELIPALSHNPLLDVIATAEAQWMHEAALRYPLALQSRGDDMFYRYIRCELETLSDASLDIYATEIEQAKAEGRNMVEERHNLLCQKMGFASLAEREADLALKRQISAS